MPNFIEIDETMDLWAVSLDGHLCLSNSPPLTHIYCFFLCYTYYFMWQMIFFSLSIEEKRYRIFFTFFNILASQRDPLGQRSPVWVVVQQPPLPTCKISSHSDDPCPRYMLPNFVDFLAGVTHKKDPKTYSKRYNKNRSYTPRSSLCRVFMCNYCMQLF